MVDPLSISQLVIAIPQVIDYSVKSIRVLRDYKNINSNLRFSLDRAQHLVLCLQKYVTIVQCTALTDDVRIHCEKALRRAYHYTNKLKATLNGWTVRLQLGRQDICKRVYLDNNDSLEKQPSLSKDLNGFYSSLAPYTISCCQRFSATLESVRLTCNKMRYLALGTLSIHEALHKLEITNSILGDFVPISQHLHHLLSYNELGAEFTRMAKSRNESHTTFLPLKLSLALMEETDDPIFFKVTQQGEYEGCIVERRFVDDLNRAGQEKRALVDTERIAKMLREDKQATNGITTAEVGILRCCGYMKPDEDTHELVFRKPKGYTARTLRKVLTTPGTEMHRLDKRIEFAIKLATAVHIFHSIGFVHKGIKPESILVMEPMSDAGEYFHDLGTPYLAGFNAARYDESASGMYRFDKLMNKKLYHDPRQLGTNRPQKYQMRDDIYSLGVCLLEIGLWKSVFRWEEVRKTYVVDAWAADLFADVPFTGEDSAQLYDDTEFLVDTLRKKKLINLARTLLATKVPAVFGEAVVACLTFGDGDDSLSAQTGNYAGSAKFYTNVICDLHRAKAIKRQCVGSS